MRKIIVVTHAGGSPHHGPNMRWYFLGQAMKHRGVEVEIVSSTSFHKYLNPPDIHGGFESRRIDGLVYHWVKSRPYRNRGPAQVFNQLEFTLRCFMLAASIAERRPDLVVASSPHPFVVYPARAIAERSGADFVFEVRDLWPEILLEAGGFSRMHPYILLLKAAERFAVKHASTIVSVKPGEGEYFEREYGLDPKRFFYAPNGFFPPSFSSSGGALPEAVRAARNEYSFLIGYVGALSAYYDLERLVGLAEHLRDRRGVGFVVVGQGERRNPLIRQAERLGLDNIRFVDAIPRRDVPAVLDCMDACYVGLEDLALHRYGVSCNKIYEYMYAARPIIGSYRAGHDPVGRAGCGFVAPPGEYDALARGVDALVADPGLAAEYGRRARKYFDENHDFRIVSSGLVDRFFGREATDNVQAKKA